jgi:hypothetical protein
MARTIQSPGVEIKEVDLSLRPELPAGTTVLIPGFAHQGPTDEIILITSISEFEQLYGAPSNSAERYLYHTARAALNSTANVNIVRLSYGQGSGADVTDQYSALIYPVIPILTTAAALSAHVSDATMALSSLSAFFHAGADVKTLSASDWTAIFDDDEYKGATITYKAADILFIGEPSSITVESLQYRRLIENNLNWNTGAVLSALSAEKGGFENFTSLNGAGIVVLNKKRVAINEKFEGSYVGLVDNAAPNPGTDFESIQKLKTVTASADGKKRDFATAPDSRFTFDMNAVNDGAEGSISEVMENLTKFNLATDEFSDSISIGVFKVRGSTLEPDTTKLDYVFQEGFTGSLNYYAKQFPVQGGNAVSFFMEGEAQSADAIKVLINPNISKEAGDWIDASDENALPKKKVRVLPSDLTVTPGENIFLNDAEDEDLIQIATALKGTFIESPQNLYPTGAFKETIALGDSVAVGDIPGKLRRVFDWADNYELYDFDIITEAGLGTVFASACAVGDVYFDDETYVSAVTGLAQTKQIDSPDIVDNYLSVVTELDSFCTTRRKDCIFIADGIRHSLIQGEDSKVLDDETKTFSKDIYWPLRHTFQKLNTSFGVAYANWAKAYDISLNKNVWVPFSGFAAAAMANTDSNFYPWYAPAGFTRGIVTGAVDLACSPKQKHRDALYKSAINPVANFPNDGLVIFGQKTLQAKPSAFDRINVRRMFLYVEKAVRSVMKYFVFEPNTLLTRTQVTNVLSPIFDHVKNTDGLYDYMLVCDERNNSASVIDRNELIVDIYIKPVRSAEFILVNFFATRTDQNFSELVT